MELLLKRSPFYFVALNCASSTPPSRQAASHRHEPPRLLCVAQRRAGAASESDGELEHEPAERSEHRQAHAQEDPDRRAPPPATPLAVRARASPAHRPPAHRPADRWRCSLTGLSGCGRRSARPSKRCSRPRSGGRRSSRCSGATTRRRRRRRCRSRWRRRRARERRATSRSGAPSTAPGSRLPSRACTHPSGMRCGSLV